MKQVLHIILISIAAAVLFGILHNQVTVRISLEYFTIGHPRLITSESPTLLGIAWGIHPNWWVGLASGVLFSLAGRAGRWPRRSAVSFVKPLLVILLVSAAASATAGIIGYHLAQTGALRLHEPFVSQVPPEGQPAFISALWMHTASYTAATMGALITALLVFTGRIRADRENKTETGCRSNQD